MEEGINYSVGTRGLMWEARDVDGRPVNLSLRNFEAHLHRHPEIKDYAGEAKQAVEEPDFVIEGDNGAYFYYKAGPGRDMFAHCYVLVIVRYRGGDEGAQEGRVATFYFTTKVVEGRQVWPRES